MELFNDCKRFIFLEKSYYESSTKKLPTSEYYKCVSFVAIIVRSSRLSEQLGMRRPDDQDLPVPRVHRSPLGRAGASGKRQPTPEGVRSQKH